MNTTCLTQVFAEGRYILPPLPYGDAAREPPACAEPLYLHHDKPHAAYVAGANAALDTLRLINEGALSPAQAMPATQSLAFNLGGHILHTLYWENLGAQRASMPGEEMTRALENSFGSYNSFVRLFSSVAVAVQGSGWAVLGVDPVSRGLQVAGIHRHQDALVPGFCPLLVCDVWEHAYYLTWSNDRKGYVDSFMKHINWETVEQRYERSLRNEF